MLRSEQQNCTFHVLLELLTKLFTMHLQLSVVSLSHLPYREKKAQRKYRNSSNLLGMASNLRVMAFNLIQVGGHSSKRLHTNAVLCSPICDIESIARRRKQTQTHLLHRRLPCLFSFLVCLTSPTHSRVQSVLPAL